MKKLSISFFMLCLAMSIYSQPIIENGVLLGWDNPPANLVIPDDVQTVNARSFKGNTNIKSIDFNKVKFIESGSFTGCTALESVKMPNVVKINARAFEGVVKLKSLYLPKCIIIQPFAFHDCKSLETVELTIVKIIDRNAFTGCIALTKVDLGKAVNLTRVGGVSEEKSIPAFDLKNKNLTIYISNESKNSLFPSLETRKYSISVDK